MRLEISNDFLLETHAPFDLLGELLVGPGELRGPTRHLHLQAPFVREHLLEKQGPFECAGNLLLQRVVDGGLGRSSREQDVAEGLVLEHEGFQHPEPVSP